MHFGSSYSKIATFQHKCRTRGAAIGSCGLKREAEREQRQWPARKGTASRNGPRAYAGAYAEPTQSLRGWRQFCLDKPKPDFPANAQRCKPQSCHVATLPLVASTSFKNIHVSSQACPRGRLRKEKNHDAREMPTRAYAPPPKWPTQT